MAIVRWEPFSLRPRHRLPRWFDEEFDFWPEPGDGLDLYETDDDIVVEANVPGVSKDDIEVTVEGGVITIHGELKEEDEREEEGKQYFKKMERRSFHYSTTLPRSVDSNKAEAEVANGVVKVTIPKSEAEKPKRIEIKSK